MPFLWVFTLFPYYPCEIRNMYEANTKILHYHLKVVVVVKLPLHRLGIHCWISLERQSCLRKCKVWYGDGLWFASTILCELSMPCLLLHLNRANTDKSTEALLKFLDWYSLLRPEKIFMIYHCNSGKNKDLYQKDPSTDTKLPRGTNHTLNLLKESTVVSGREVTGMVFWPSAFDLQWRSAEKLQISRSHCE